MIESSLTTWGPILYGLSISGAMGHSENMHISFLQCLLFSALIAAVDPVAVLAIFQEIKVNHVLYILVFGESLFNDAVTVVIYRTVQGLNCLVSNHVEITTIHYVTAVVSFFTVSLGGIIVGLVMGILCSFLTKYTSDVRVVEPLTIFSTAYLAYIIAELFHWSGIIAMIACGLVQANYAFHNIDANSLVTVTYFIKMASASSDCVIFLYLGSNLVNINHIWNLGFLFWSIFFTLLIRFVSIYLLTYFLNKYWRVRTVAAKEQFIMAYGGLRGAVAFSLASLLHGQLPDDLQTMFVTTTLCIVLFTVFVQGVTIKPLVSLLEVTTAGDRKDDGAGLMFEALNDKVTDHVMAGIEEVIGNHGRFFLLDWVTHIDDHYFKHWLQSNPLSRDELIMKTYEKLIIDHYQTTVGKFTKVVAGSQQFPNSEYYGPGSAFYSEHKGSGSTLPGFVKAPSSPSIPQGCPPNRFSLKESYAPVAESPTHIRRRQPGGSSKEPGTHKKEKSRRGSSTIKSVGDFQKILVDKDMLSNFNRSSRHLVREDSAQRGLASMLQEKNRRLERYRRSLTPSMLGALPQGFPQPPTQSQQPGTCSKQSSGTQQPSGHRGSGGSIVAQGQGGTVDGAGTAGVSSAVSTNQGRTVGEESSSAAGIGFSTQSVQLETVHENEIKPSAR